MSEWISVKERLPDEDTPYGRLSADVMCKTRSGAEIIACLARTSNGDVWFDRDWCERDITHWMPLPPPPEGEE